MSPGIIVGEAYGSALPVLPEASGMIKVGLNLAIP